MAGNPSCRIVGTLPIACIGLRTERSAQRHQPAECIRIPAKGFFQRRAAMLRHGIQQIGKQLGIVDFVRRSAPALLRAERKGKRPQPRICQGTLRIGIERLVRCNAVTAPDDLFLVHIAWGLPDHGRHNQKIDRKLPR
jgi:hypothetical protein